MSQMFRCVSFPAGRSSEYVKAWFLDPVNGLWAAGPLNMIDKIFGSAGDAMDWVEVNCASEAVCVRFESKDGLKWMIGAHVPSPN